jgi:predicted DNA-binding transcriptional regulator
MNKLTKRQNEVYNKIINFITVNQRSPSYRELGAELGIKSTNGVSDHVKVLKKKGLLRNEAKIIPVSMPKKQKTSVSSSYIGLNKTQKLLLFVPLLTKIGSMPKNEVLSKFGICERTWRRWAKDMYGAGIVVYTWRCKKTKTHFVGTPHAYGQAMIGEMNEKLNKYNKL